MFPGGWPGVGLLLLRLAAATPLLIERSSEFLGASEPGHYIRFVGIGVGALLLAGLWTPIAGTLQAIMEVWIALHRGAVVHLPLAALGVSLVMVGPGAWSLDARLFGRKRIRIS
jgi:putative oxidoreductase